jgi:hypothetical protein
VRLLDAERLLAVAQVHRAERARAPAAERLVGERARRLLPPDPAVAGVRRDEPRRVVLAVLLDGREGVPDATGVGRDEGHDRDDRRRGECGEHAPDRAFHPGRQVDVTLEVQRPVAGGDQQAERDEGDRPEDAAVVDARAQRGAVVGEAVERERDAEHRRRRQPGQPEHRERAQAPAPESDQHDQRDAEREEAAARVGQAQRQHERVHRTERGEAHAVVLLAVGRRS